MVRHTQIICQQQPENCLSVFDHFVVLLLKSLTDLYWRESETYIGRSYNEGICSI